VKLYHWLLKAYTSDFIKVFDVSKTFG